MNAKKIMLFLVLPFLIYSNEVWGQMTFKKNGEVNVSSVKEFPRDKNPKADLKVFDAPSAERRKVFADAITAYLDTAIARLQNESLPASIFYDSVCLHKNPARKKLEAELTIIRTKLTGAGYNPADGRLIYFKELNQSLAKILDPTQSLYFIDSNDKGDFKQFDLKKKNPLSSFMVDYYTKVINDASYEALKDVDPKDFNKEKEQLKDLSQKVNAKLTVLRTGTDINLLIEAGQLHQQYQAFVKGALITRLLADSSTYKWIWLTGAQPVINPIDVIVASVADEKKPDVKSSLYNRYIDSVIEKYMRYDTVGEVDKFKTILAEKNNGKKLYPDSPPERILNTNILEDIQQTTTTVNKVQIPYINEKDGYKQYDGTADRSKIREEKFDPMPNSDVYVVTIHNLTSSEKGGLIATKIDTIKGDRSSTQIALDDGADKIGEAIKAVLPLASVVGNFNALFNGKTSYAVITKGMLAGVRTPDTLGTAIIRQLQEDSLMLLQYVYVAEHTTLKVYELKAKTNDSSAYHSEIFSTDEFDQAFKLKYHLIKVKDKKDTTSLAKFAFRTGRRYRFMVSAGIAYTMGNDYYVNIVTADKGKVNVETKNEPFKLMVAGHFYPFHKGVFMQDKSFCGKNEEILSRINLTFGIAIPKPLENFYLGLGYDFGPGIHLTGGCHLYAFRNYKMHNDQIEQEHVTYRAAPFAAISIDPTTLVKVFNIFNN